MFAESKKGSLKQKVALALLLVPDCRGCALQSQNQELVFLYGSFFSQHSCSSPSHPQAYPCQLLSHHPDLLTWGVWRLFLFPCQNTQSIKDLLLFQTTHTAQWEDMKEQLASLFWFIGNIMGLPKGLFQSPVAFRVVPPCLQQCKAVR